MNKLLFALAIAVIFCSCSKDDNFAKNTKKRIANCTTSKSFTVPVRDGFATYVLYGDDTLAVATEPITIQIPKISNVLTKGSAEDDISLKYEILNGQTTYSKSWQAIMFEDHPRGDYDYNDLIIHVRSMHSWNKLTIDVQPIALGGQKVIKLGLVIANDGSEHIIAEDVRRDLFSDAKGYINTENDKDPIHYNLKRRLTYELEKGKDEYAIMAWFIEVDGKRYFAVNGDVSYDDYDMLNEEGMPYGLSIYGGNGTFNYPIEKKSMFDVYPGFEKWINGDAANIGTYNDKSLIYKYCYTSIPGTDFGKIWDYVFEP